MRTCVMTFAQYDVRDAVVREELEVVCWNFAAQINFLGEGGDREGERIVEEKGREKRNMISIP